MKDIVYDYAANAIIAIATSEDDAHTIAEALSYKRNGNAIYGLFKIGLVSRDVLLSTELGAMAIQNWHERRAA